MEIKFESEDSKCNTPCPHGETNEGGFSLCQLFILPRVQKLY